MTWVLENSPVQIYLYGDAQTGKQLQEGVLNSLKTNNIDTSRVKGICGEWDLDKSLAFALEADIVIGPETGVLNLVGHEPMAKIIYLSHSSEDNLTKNWINTVTLTPENTPCYPCHMLHYTWDHCHKVEKTGAALCATNIKPERVFKSIMSILVDLAKKVA